MTRSALTSSMRRGIQLLAFPFLRGSFQSQEPGFDPDAAPVGDVYLFEASRATFKIIGLAFANAS